MLRDGTMTSCLLMFFITLWGLVRAAMYDTFTEDFGHYMEGPRGRRRGRPTKTWRSTFKEDLVDRGVDWNSIRAVATNRIGLSSVLRPLQHSIGYM